MTRLLPAQSIKHSSLSLFTIVWCLIKYVGFFCFFYFFLFPYKVLTVTWWIALKFIFVRKHDLGTSPGESSCSVYASSVRDCVVCTPLQNWTTDCYPCSVKGSVILRLWVQCSMHSALSELAKCSYSLWPLSPIHTYDTLVWHDTRTHTRRSEPLPGAFDPYGPDQ